MSAGLVFLGLMLGLFVAAILVFRRAARGRSLRGGNSSRASSDRTPLSSHDVYSPLFFSSSTSGDSSSHPSSSAHDGGSRSSHDCSCDSSSSCCDSGGSSCDSGGGSCGCD